MHAQIVADTLGIPFENVEVNAADTGEVPDSGPTVASRTCMVVGRILQRCAEEMRRQLGSLTPRAYLKKHGPLVITREYEKPDEITWDDASYKGDAYGSYGWACDVVELDVDPDTWQVTPVRFTTVHEIGKAIHPRLTAGQIEGGSAQGIGYGLLEEVVMREGRMANNQLTNYIIPTTLDTPPIDVIVLENPYTARPVRRERCRGDADRRPGAGDHQRLEARRIRSAGDSGDAGADHGASQDVSPPRSHRREDGTGTRVRRDKSNAIHPERQARQRLGASHEASPRRAARGLRVDGHEGRLRGRRVRRLHGDRRWPAGELVPRAVRACGRREGDDDRRVERPSPAAAGVCRTRRRAMRHLHAGHDHGGCRARPEAVDRRRCASASPATCAAARAIRRSTNRFGMRRRTGRSPNARPRHHDRSTPRTQRTNPRER